jgi:hypothetical protein
VDRLTFLCRRHLNRHSSASLSERRRRVDGDLAQRLFYRLPYMPSSTPDDGIWSLLKRAMINFAVAGLGHLARIVKRKLKKIQ